MIADRDRRGAAAALGAAGGLLLVLAVVAAAAGPLTWSQLRSGGVVSNTISGAAFVGSATPIAWARPRNRLGWLLLVAGLGFLVSGAGYAVLAWRAPGQHAGPGWALLADATDLGWPVGVGFVLPLLGLLFPAGRLPGPRWRPFVTVVLLNGFAFMALVSLGRQTSTSELHVRRELRWSAIDHVGWLGAVFGLVGFAAYAAAIAVLIRRYRRGTEQVRRQVLWLLLGVLITFVCFLLSDVLNVDLLGALGVIVLPASVLVALLRHQLLDVRVVVARSLVFLVLSAAVVASYLLVVVLADAALGARVRYAPPVLGGLAVALGLNPARVALQRLVERMLYGRARDPVRAAVEVGSRLAVPAPDEGTGLADILDALCDVLHVPWAELQRDGETVAHRGGVGPIGEVVPLQLGSERVGELQVGARWGEGGLGKRDRAVLELLSHSLAVAVHATSLAADLGAARAALVTTREEERRRLRHELHDGVGPVLTGVMLTADAARRTSATNADEAAELMGRVRTQAASAIEEVRRLARGLRPAILDGMGLADALREHAAMLAPLEVEVRAGGLPVLPAAVEVAAYRIATEALTNVSRHARANQARVDISVTAAGLVVDVHDDGTSARQWEPGVGLSSLRLRAEELGGRLAAGAGPDGGRLTATLPLAAP